MPPKIDNDRVNRAGLSDNQPTVKKVKTSEPRKEQVIEKTSILTRQSDAKIYGDQQRERLERLFGAGAAGQSSYIDAYKAQAFGKADKAYLDIIGNESIKLTKAAELGLTEYKNVLDRYKVNHLESSRPNLLGALDFLKAEANRSGGLSALDQTALRQLAQNGDQPRILVRMLWAGDNNLDKPDARLAYFDSAKNEGKTIAWASRPEDLGGSRLDYQETMRRFGWTADQIADAKAGDYKFAVFTADAAVDLKNPTEQVITERAKSDDKVFGKFKREPESFWKKVGSYDYEGKLKEANKLGFDHRNVGKFVNKLSPEEGKVFEARHQMEKRMGVNPLFTGDGTTKRPDDINGKVGVREYITNNTVEDATLRAMAKKGQVAFVDMQDLGFLDDYKKELADFRTKTGDPKATLPLPEISVDVNAKPSKLPTVSRGSIIKTEMRSGAIAGGIFSAATSLTQVYDQARRGDYKGAATTFAVNTGGGATLGALSAGGERIVGRGVENALSRSNPANKGLERLYANPAARNVVSRLVQTEASTLTSQTFNTTLRTVAGRVGGAGVIGGVVSGALSSYDQIGAYRRGEVSGSQAFGTIVGETSVGVGAGLAGAAAGAAIGSIIPGAGTIVGGVIGFGVGMAAGYLADKGLRGLGVDKAIAKGVTATIDAGSRVAGAVQRRAGQVAQAGRQYVGRQITQARAVYRSASSAVKSAGAFVGQKLDNARQRVSNATRAAVSYVSQVRDRTIQAVRHTAGRAINQVRSTVGNVANQVGSTVNNIANQARSTVSNAVNNVAGGAVNTLKSVFGF